MNTEIQNTDFVNQLRKMKNDEVLKFDKVSFEELINLKYPIEFSSNPSILMDFYKYSISAIYKERDGELLNNKCVIVTMVSRYGDVGITNDIKNPTHYIKRVDPKYLSKFEIRLKKK